MTNIEILLVEDNLDLQIEMHDYLSHFGSRVHVATNLAQMQQKLSSETIHIVLLDLGLPDGDGLASIAPLRAQFGLTIGIIVVSARGAHSDRVEALAAGADFYIVKPIYLAELKQVLERLYERLQRDRPAGWSLCLMQMALISPDGQAIALTGKEFRLLQLLAEQQQPVDRAVLMNCLYPHAQHCDSRPLDTLISRLRKKIASYTNQQLTIRSHRNQGYSVSALSLR